MRKLKIKICGLKNNLELKKIDDTCQPDYVGLIFVKESPRCFQDQVTKTTKAKKIGVFQNAALEEIIHEIVVHQLHGVQLHGNETPAFCAKLKSFVQVWKAIGVEDISDLHSAAEYADYCHKIVLDTRINSRSGGTGKAFNWNLLSSLPTSVSFILSGGISPEHVQQINNIQHAGMIGLDLNSRFEKSPGVKDAALIQNFIKNIFNDYNISAS